MARDQRFVQDRWPDLDDEAAGSQASRLIMTFGAANFWFDPVTERMETSVPDEELRTIE